MPQEMTASITKTVTIDRAASEVFAFLSDPLNWPKWAVANVYTVEPTSDPAWWLMNTRQGRARMSIHGNAELGVLDHDFVDENASWRVPARVVPNGAGAVFMMTFMRPPDFSNAYFAEQMNLVDDELLTLKRILESDDN